jgi:hypothetical protein
MKSFELPESEIEKMSTDELMGLQLGESMDSINESIEKTNNRVKHFIGLLVFSIVVFTTFSFHVGWFLFFISFIVLVLAYRANEELKIKLMSHKMLILFLQGRGIVNNGNSYLLEKYSIKEFKNKA